MMCSPVWRRGQAVSTVSVLGGLELKFWPGDGYPDRSSWFGWVLVENARFVF
jgi:hypothetical protein